MSSIANITQDAVRQALYGMCFTKGVLAINAGGAATVRTTNALTYSVGGALFTKAALSAQAITPTHRYDGSPVSAIRPAYVQPVSSTVVYLVCLNAAGTVAVVQGSFAGQQIADPVDLSQVITGAGGNPTEPEGYTCVGSLTVTTNGATTFTPGTTLLDAAGVTIVYRDVSIL